MLTFSILYVLDTLLDVLFVVVPSVTLASIPLVGSYISEFLLLGVGYMNAFFEIVPYAELPWRLFLLVILPFEISLLLLKVLLGSRLPANVN